MSWIQWLGENWEATSGSAELHLHIWPPEAMCPRIAWSLDIRHYDVRDDPATGKRATKRWLDVEIGNLHFREPDWRKLAGLEIRADAAWHEAHEHYHEYGRPDAAEVSVSTCHLARSVHNPAAKGHRDEWVGHDFLLRLGTRDGFGFPCEIDAWLLPRKEYYSTVPESPAELARFGEGPPDLRVITRLAITRCQVDVPRCDDPIPVARRILREEVGLDEVHRPELEWAIRRTLDRKVTERPPGWTSTVTLLAGPEPVAEQKAV